jgi:hypothetical protein
VTSSNAADDGTQNAADSGSRGTAYYSGGRSGSCAAHYAGYARRRSSNCADGTACFFAVVPCFNMHRLALWAIEWRCAICLWRESIYVLHGESFDGLRIEPRNLSCPQYLDTEQLKIYCYESSMGVSSP